MKRILAILVTVALVGGTFGVPLASAGLGQGWVGTFTVEKGFEKETYILVMSPYNNSEDEVNLRIDGNLSEHTDLEQTFVTLDPQETIRVPLYVDSSDLSIGERVNGTVVATHQAANPGAENPDGVQEASGAEVEWNEQYNISVQVAQPTAGSVSYLLAIPFLGTISAEQIFGLIVILMTVIVIGWYAWKEGIFVDPDEEYIG